MPTTDTDICIEGFQRSGNTYAVIAFQFAQPGHAQIAHHVHAPGAVIAAVRLGIPVVILVRRPEDAIVSTVIRWPHITVRQALRAYVRFHDPLAPYRDRVVVGRFDDLIADFDAIIDGVNRRFGTTFSRFGSSEDSVRTVLEELDRWDRNALGQGEALERGRARPTAWRRRLKLELEGRYRAPRLGGLRARAEELYLRFAGDREPGQGPGRARTA